MSLERPSTLRDLRRLDQLKVVESQSAVVLRPGDQILFIDYEMTMDLDLDSVRGALQSVFVEESVRGNPAITIPGTRTQFEIATLLPAHLQTSPQFFYMTPEGPIPDWFYRKPQPESRESVQGKVGSVQAFSGSPGRIIEDEGLANLVRHCSIFKYDVIQLFLRWFMRPDISLASNNGFLSVSSSGPGWKDFYDLLRIQLEIHGFTVDEKLNEVEIPIVGINKDFFKIALFAIRHRKISCPNAPSSPKVRGQITKIPSRSLCALQLYPK